MASRCRPHYFRVCSSTQSAPRQEPSPPPPPNLTPDLDSGTQRSRRMATSQPHKATGSCPPRIGCAASAGMSFAFARRVSDGDFHSAYSHRPSLLILIPAPSAKGSRQQTPLPRHILSRTHSLCGRARNCGQRRAESSPVQSSDASAPRSHLRTGFTPPGASAGVTNVSITPLPLFPTKASMKISSSTANGTNCRLWHGGVLHCESLDSQRAENAKS